MDDSCLVALLRRHLCLTADEALRLSRRLLRVRRISDLPYGDDRSAQHRVPIFVRRINGCECVVVACNDLGTLAVAVAQAIIGE